MMPGQMLSGRRPNGIPREQAKAVLLVDLDPREPRWHLSFLPRFIYELVKSCQRFGSP